MNTIYNVVWNSTTGTWVVASEMAKGRKKKSKAASAATAAALVTTVGLGAGAAVMPSTAMAGTSGLCMTSTVQGAHASRGYETYTSPSGPGTNSCLDTYGWNGSSYQYNIAGDPTTAPRQLNSSVFLRAETTDVNKVAAMWLNGDEGSINFDIGPVLGQVIKIKSNGQMTGLTDGLIAAGSTDAITGNQAFQLQSKIEQINSGNGKVKYFNVNSGAADSSATGTEAVAIGPVAKAQSTGGVAIGSNASTAANTNGNVAIGQNASASGNTSTALGNNARATNASATALGNDAGATGEYATAVGMHNVASGTNSIAVGNGANAAGTSGIAIGSGSASEADWTFAAGNGSAAKGVGDTALGASAVANGGGQWSTALGTQAQAQTTRTTAVGGGAIAAHDNSVAVGYGSTTDRTNSVSVGTAQSKRQLTNLAQGTQGTDAVNLDQLNAVASKIGSGSTKYFHTNTGLADSVTNGADSIAIGGGAASDGKWSLAAGTNAKATGDNSVALGNSSFTDRANSVSVGHSGVQRQIVYVAKGTQGTDAVNVDQLKGVTAAIGGGVAVDGNGNVSNKITVAGNTYNTVAEAIADARSSGGSSKYFHTNTTLADSVTTGADSIAIGGNAASNGKWSLAAGTNAKATGDNSVALGNGSLADRANSVSVGSVGNQRQITNVANGTRPEDAVNVAQFASAGFTVDTAGIVTNPAVTYKAGSIATGSPLVLLDRGVGDSKYFVDGDRSKGKLPKGTVISNVADGTQDTDAANRGTVFNIVAEAMDGGLRSRTLVPLVAGEGSGVDSTGLSRTYKTAAYYSQVSGKADSTGSATPSDIARAYGAGSIAIGSNSFSQAATSTAVGVQAYIGTAARDAVALGSGSYASEANTVSIGSDGKGEYIASDVNGNDYTIKNQANTRRLVNMAAGKAATDAVNVSQLQPVVDGLGGGAKVDPASGVVTGPTYVVEGTKVYNVGDAITNIDGRVTNVTNTVNNITSGGGIKYFHAKSTLADSTATGNNSVAVGGAANAAGASAVAIGSSASASADWTFAAGNSAAAKSAGDVALGASSLANGAGSYSTALGANAQATTTKTTAVGAGAKATFNNSVALGQDSATDRVNSVAVGSATSQRQVTFVAKGTQGTDAVNVDQLKGVASAIGGGAAVNTDGSINKPAITVGGTKYDNVADAIGAVDAKTGGNPLAVSYDDTTKAKVTLNKGGAGQVTLANVKAGVGDDEAINVSQLKSAGIIDSTGKVQKAVLFDGPNGEANVASQKIINVASGSVGASSKDAINGSQLYGTADSVAKALGGSSKVNADGTVGAPSYTVQGQANIADVGTALSKVDTAITNIVNGKVGLVQQAAPGQKLTVGKDTDGVEVDMSSKTGQRQLTGVAKGLGANSAANVAQLSSAGFSIDGTGNVINAAVTYKAGSIASGSPVVVLDKGAGDSAYFVDGDRKKGKLPKGTVISNVANGVQDTDAANLGMVYDIVTKAGDNGPDMFATRRTLVPLVAGEGSGVDTTGLSKTYKTAAYYSQVSGKADSTGSAAPSDVARAYGAGSIAIGSNSFSQATTSTAVGVQAYIGAAARDAVALGSGSYASEANTVSIGSDGKGEYIASDVNGNDYTIKNQANTRRLVNMAAGKAATDAVNVSQLQPVVDGLGGGAKVDPASGVVTGPTYVVEGTKVYNVGDAITNIDGRVTQVFEGKAGLVQQAKAGDDLTVGVATDGKGVNFTGTAGDRILHGVAGGKINSDAVNISQLKDVASVISKGATVDASTGKITLPEVDVNGTKYDDILAAINGVDGKASTGSALGVAYDDATRTKVTLNPGAGKGPVTIANVKAGVDNGDAVNVKQLKDAGLLDPGTGEALEAVVYDKGSNKGSVSFGGANGTVLKNVGAGLVNSTSKEAVNGSQLFAAGQSVADAIGGGSKMGADGKVSKPSISVGGKSYDTVAGAIGAIEATAVTGNPLGVAYDDATKASVTFNKGGAPVKLGNVKNGVAGNDAVNASQLKAVVDGLGGDAKIDPATGIVAGPTYNVTNVDGSKTEMHNVGDVINNLDGRTATNTTNIQQVIDGKVGLVQQAKAGDKLTVGKDADGTEVNFTGKAGDRKLSGVAKGTADNDAVNVKQLKDAGLVDGNGNIANAVTYDSDAKESVTFGNTGKPVTLKNVADGSKDDEAINFGQFKKAGLIDTDGKALDAVVYDAGSNKGSVTFGGGANGTVLDNVANGRIETGSRQAINGGQLAAIKDALEGKITNIDNRVTRIENNGVGGGSPDYISANGVGGSPKPADAGDSPGVAMGFDSNASGEGASVIGDHAKAEGKDSVAIGNNASATAAGGNSVALGNGSVADRADTVSVGSAGHERTVSNVARGTAETDAVNVGLLNERINAIGASSNAYTDKAINDVWTNLSEEIDHSNRQANRGIAAASALINVTPYVPGHVTVNAGVAGYRGESALGVGVSRWSENGRVNLNAGVSAAQGDEPVYRVGIGYIF
ncbi:YadA-like family protein [Luteibacter sp.]|uniref:YadA-like family protein n=1 Tax=Luteibacter sp. TaxID=1886636 RepID=UPI002806E8C6|nr:YadA-like family protein [Luteibacter sp.]MDQ8051125.1 YadA-like family protein [Luteibacter sp.]